MPDPFVLHRLRGQGRPWTTGSLRSWPGTSARSGSRWRPGRIFQTVLWASPRRWQNRDGCLGRILGPEHPRAQIRGRRRGNDLGSPASRCSPAGPHPGGAPPERRIVGPRTSCWSGRRVMKIKTISLDAAGEARANYNLVIPTGWGITSEASAGWPMNNGPDPAWPRGVVSPASPANPSPEVHLAGLAGTRSPGSPTAPPRGRCACTGATRPACPGRRARPAGGITEPSGRTCAPTHSCACTRMCGWRPSPPS
jgi:hypothetical protein